MPAGYSLGSLTNLFAFPKLFGNVFSASVLSSMSTTLQAYIVQCAPGNTDGVACATFSPSCAAQTYAQGKWGCLDEGGGSNAVPVHRLASALTMRLCLGSARRTKRLSS